MTPVSYTHLDVYKRQHLEGPTALAVSKEDATAPARILAEFAKTADKLELKAGVVEAVSYTHLKPYPGIKQR